MRSSPTIVFSPDSSEDDLGGIGASESRVIGVT